MTDRELARDAFTLDLAETIPPGTEVLAGDPAARVRTLGAVGELEVGLWSLTPGTVRDVEADEIFIVLEGSGRVTFEDGASIDLAPGVVVRLAAGEVTEWTVTETIRKIYVSG